ncbi:MAG TPA: IPT/TIG domain-containing protein [Polyangiaceae bacterium]|nr:IPT/TIG domain-containing protein [Polyangiaceae bacterium]
MPTAQAALIALLGALLLYGCLSRSKPINLHRLSDVDGGMLPVGNAPNATDASLPPLAAHSVAGVNPSIGPFKGGVRALVRGTGFSSEARVWFADTEVPSADIVPIDPNRLQVIVPPGEPGAVDVTVQNGDDASSKATLRAGFVYDSFYADPAVGPTTGGTRITLFGKGVSWTDQTTVSIDQQPCDVLELRSPADQSQELDCQTPAGTAGAKPITTVNEDGTEHSVLGAFTYSDSSDGFRGGLSGHALENDLQVLVLDNFAGSPLTDVTVMLGSDPKEANSTLGRTDQAGLVHFSGSLGPTQTITLAKKCFQPITFVDVPVDHATVYLDPILSPACVPPQSDPPLVPSGSFGVGAQVEGQLVWPTHGEFQSNDWGNVPPPVTSSQRRVAYLFQLSHNPWRPFQLPRPSLAVTEDSRSSQGYAFRTDAQVGNLTLYALAGVEDLTATPPFFQAYAIGLVRGVATEPLGVTSDVFIKMDNTLDQSLRFSITGPSPTPRGPDRVEVAVALRIGTEGYAILPSNQKSALLPTSSQLEFVGVPPLVGSLQNAQYVANAHAVTGLLGDLPESDIGPLAASTTANVLALKDFLEIPQLIAPAPNGAWDARSISLDWVTGGPEVSLAVVDLQSAGGLVDWLVVSPMLHKEIQLPDLEALLPEGALPRGNVSILVNLAQLDDFDYGQLGYNDLATNSWRAAATDQFQVRY